jgi:hypothetical protein
MESIDILAVYKKLLLPPFLSKKAQSPPMKPPRNQRCVERKARGSMVWKRQMEPQLVPMAPERKSDMRSMRLARLFNEAMGEERKALYFVMLIAVKKRVKKRATLGKAWIQYWT